jgi:hypothetical protein
VLVNVDAEVPGHKGEAKIADRDDGAVTLRAGVIAEGDLGEPAAGRVAAVGERPPEAFW